MDEIEKTTLILIMYYNQVETLQERKNILDYIEYYQKNNNSKYVNFINALHQCDIELSNLFNAYQKALECLIKVDNQTQTKNKILEFKKKN